MGSSLSCNRSGVASHRILTRAGFLINGLVLAVMLCAICAAPALAAEPSIAWEKLLGGSGSDDGNSVEQTNDGGYILVGTSGSTDGDLTSVSSPGPFDLWVVKMNAAGTIQWQRLLGGSDDDGGSSVQQTSDGGYIIAASSDSSANGDVTGTNHGETDIWVVKLGSAGSIQWQRLLGGSGRDTGESIRQTADGGYILVADTLSSASGDVTGTNHGDCDIWAVKLSSAGQIQWQRLFGGSGTDWAHAVQQTADGGYILIGSSDSSQSGDVTAQNHGQTDLWAVKMDRAGRVQWQKLLGGSESDLGQSGQQTADGGYIILGGSGSSRDGDVTDTNHGEWSDFWVVKLNGEGAVQWNRLIGGDTHDVGHSVRQTADGGYFLVGESRSPISGDISGQNHGFFDIWAVKLSGTGTIQWQKVLGGSGDDRGYSGLETASGEYVVLGYSKSSDGDVSTKVHGRPDMYGVYPTDLWVVKLDGAGGSTPPTTPTTPSTALPTVTGISPSSAARGATVSTVIVSGTAFAPGAEVAILGGTGGTSTVFATGETTVSASEIRCSLAIPATAYTGPYYVFVRNPGATWVYKATAFTVTAPTTTTATVTKISPSIASPGETMETVTVSGTAFAPGAEVAIMSEGGGGRTTVYATGETTVSAGQIRCSLAVPDTAEPGFYYVFVRNPGARWVYRAKAFRVF